MESWEKPDLDRWAAGQRSRPLPEGVIFGHQEYRPDLVQRLLDENPALDFYDYFNVWTFPDYSWVKHGNLYFDAVWNLLATGGNAWVDPTTQFSGVSPKDRMVIRWTDSGAAAAVSAMLEARPLSRRGFFLDVFEPDGPYQWMFKSFDGAFDVTRLEEDQVARHQTALDMMPARLAKTGKVLTNGTLGHLVPGYGLAARYFEQTGTQPGMPWPEVLPESVKHSGNVISVLAENRAAVDIALTNWLRHGGWLAFTTSLEGAQGQAAVDDAYARAYYSRAERLSAPPPAWPPTGPTDPTDPTDPDALTPLDVGVLPS